jgi:excisionase family DNA binding protein
MHSQLSPKDLALVIGVSESSLKRWVDEGRLVAARTVGGHRRIAIHEAIRFIRETGASVVRPDLLGMAELTESPVSMVTTGAGESALLAALQSGNAEQARGLIIAQCLTTRSVASVADGPITYAMHRIGELWRHSEHGVTIEHRAVTICAEALHQVRTMLPPPPEGAPVAVGGSLESDPYMLPTLIAATCFMEIGVRDINLGADTPVGVILDAARQNRAQFVWLSVSSVGDSVDLVKRISELADGTVEIGASLMVGGRRVYGLALPERPGLHMIHSMSELVAFAKAAMSKGSEGGQTGRSEHPGASNGRRPS